MFNINPQYITDSDGKKISVILSVKEFQSLIEELEELEDIKLYDKAKENETEFIDAEQAFKEIETKQKSRSGRIEKKRSRKNV